MNMEEMNEEEAKQLLLRLHDSIQKNSEGEQPILTAIEKVIYELNYKKNNIERRVKQGQILNEVIELMLDDLSAGDQVDKYVLRSKYFNEALKRRQEQECN